MVGPGGGMGGWSPQASLTSGLGRPPDRRADRKEEGSAVVSPRQPVQGRPGRPAALARARGVPRHREGGWKKVGSWGGKRCIGAGTLLPDAGVMLVVAAGVEGVGAGVGELAVGCEVGQGPEQVGAVGELVEVAEWAKPGDGVAAGELAWR